MLALENVGFAYRGNKALFEKLTAQVTAGDLAQVCGSNGAGKTTLLRCLHGDQDFSSGAMHLRSGITSILLPQITSHEFHIDLSFADILRFSLETYSEDKILALGLLKDEDLQRTWNEASGGERQKLLLVKTFLSPQQLVLLDEPFNHLDQKTADALPSLLQNFLATHPEKAVVFVNHQALLTPSKRIILRAPARD